MSSIKSIAFGVVLVAIVGPMCLNFWTEAQKTAANSFQQQFGSNQNSAYGGYQTSSLGANRQRENSFVAPSNQQRRPVAQQSGGYSQRTESVQRQQAAYQPQQQVVSSSSSSSSSYDQAEADAEPASYGSVAGQPGTDFPNYTRVPKTSFSCDGLPYDYGMYADEETGCQAYHVCYNGRKDSFLCGPGTVFNQRILHCDYWYSVDCGKSSQYYSSNAYMGSSQPEPGPAQASSSSSSQQSYKSQVASSSSNRPANFQRPQPQQQQQQYSYNQQQQQVQESY